MFQGHDLEVSRSCRERGCADEDEPTTEVDRWLGGKEHRAEL